ncbi:MAG: efflux RND transporter periplasmic adaptor subunit [Phycisphaerales bacterium]
MSTTETRPGPTGSAAAEKPVAAATPVKPVKGGARKALLIVVVVAAALGVWWWIRGTLGVVSTDDAYVEGHVTFVAARVPGQVVRVMVDDNNRVRKGDLLVQLDKEPYQVKVEIAQAALDSALAELVLAQAQTRSQQGRTRSLRFALEQAIQDVDNQVALLRAKVAALATRRAQLTRAKADYDRVAPLAQTNAVSKEDIDKRREAMQVAEAQLEEALQSVYQIRAALGLVVTAASDDDLAKVPEDLNQNTPSVRAAEASLIQAASEMGVIESFNKSPRELVAGFYKRDPTGDIDRIYAEILKNAPAVKQAEAKVMQAKRDLEQAQLNLKYTDVVAEIDGVVTRRSVNPGNNVMAGQGLMAVRSLTEIWVEANFKETQLGRLKIGQQVDLDVDMYGGRHEFRGRISGFAMGTGSTLSLLPPENATGNFVKVVQRVPVRIDLIDYDPDKTPLIVGLSVEPRVHIDREPTGPNAGHVLQPFVTPAATDSGAKPERKAP